MEQIRNYEKENLGSQGAPKKGVNRENKRNLNTC
jgi:hypothetical protein